jgi:hypothetical protein
LYMIQKIFHRFHTNRFISNAPHIPRRIEKSVQEHPEILRCFELETRGGKKAISARVRRSLKDLRTEIDPINHDRDRSLNRF